MFRFSLFHALLLIPLTATANPTVDREQLNHIGADIGSALGTADYCGVDGQSVLAAFSQGLEAFSLRPTDIQRVLATAEQHRQQARTDAAIKRANRACPGESREKIRQALQQLEAAWYQVVQTSTGVELNAITVTTGKPATQVNGLCVKGSAVSVYYAGQWYPAKVLEGPDKLGTCKISYDGYGSDWDEWVSAKRMRADVASASPATPGQNRVTSVPPGTYNCYSFVAGQLSYTYTDVVIQDASRYAVGNETGTYQLKPDGAMTFTGTLSNATGTFSIKGTGKPQIDLAFDDSAWSSMACSRS